MMSNHTSIPRLVAYLWLLSQGQRLQMALCCLTGVMGVMLSLLFIYCTKQVIDAAASGHSFITPAVVTGGLLLSQLACSVWHRWLSTRLQVTYGNALRHRLFERLLRVQGHEVEQMHSGDVMNRIEQDCAALSTLLTTTLPGALVTLVQLAASLLFFCWLDPLLPWIVAGVLPLMLPAARLYMERMKHFTHCIRRSDSEIQSVIQESLQHRFVVQTLEQSGHHVERLDTLQSTLVRQVDDRMRFSLLARAVVAAIFSGGYLTAFLWGAYRLSQGSITFGTLTAFLQLVGKVQSPVLELSRLLPTVVGALTAVDRLMELETLGQEEQGTAIRFAETPDVVLRDVTYAYRPKDAPVLQHFSCRIAAGSMVAVVGTTGRGKTTLLKLLLALLRPQQGEVLLTAAEGYGPSGLAAESGSSGLAAGQSVEVSALTRGNFVYVPQGNTLFSGTVRDNLRMGCPEASDERLCEVLRVAEAEFVLQLPHGLDTRINELGNGLSEGQAQRIAIARALLRPGRILLLDEASSALDAATEQRLLANLRSYCQGKTLLFVTHHAAVIQACDQQIVLGECVGEDFCS